ncbi:hypothetical protein EYF80_003468 [Liparis tanakae]|uniref:Uncharacterized protein n=1 Tax=Liparis tanakae TaxID=230148 RepID=A0A4Z2J9L9_9TELE|nr:hypothetical protein EYF80_003468 [Liparis tanakae]
MAVGANPTEGQVAGLCQDTSSLRALKRIGVAVTRSGGSGLTVRAVKTARKVEEQHSATDEGLMQQKTFPKHIFGGKESASVKSVVAEVHFGQHQSGTLETVLGFHTSIFQGCDKRTTKLVFRRNPNGSILPGMGYGQQLLKEAGERCQGEVGTPFTLSLLSLVFTLSMSVGLRPSLFSVRRFHPPGPRWECKGGRVKGKEGYKVKSILACFANFRCHFSRPPSLSTPIKSDHSPMTCCVGTAVRFAPLQPSPSTSSDQVHTRTSVRGCLPRHINTSIARWGEERQGGEKRKKKSVEKVKLSGPERAKEKDDSHVLTRVPPLAYVYPSSLSVPLAFPPFNSFRQCFYLHPLLPISPSRSTTN